MNLNRVVNTDYVLLQKRVLLLNEVLCCCTGVKLVNCKVSKHLYACNNGKDFCKETRCSRLNVY